MFVRITDVGELVAGVARYGTSRVKLDLCELEDFEAREWEARLNRSLAACGCGEATAGLLLSMSLVALSAAVGASWMAGQWPVTVAVGISAAFFGVAAGKAVGKARGRLAAQRLARELAAVVQRGELVR